MRQLHALRRRGRRRRLADEKRARQEAQLEADLGGHPDERDRLDRRRPERPDGQDALRRHGRGEREQRQRGRPRPLQVDRRGQPLEPRARLDRRREQPLDRVGCGRAGQREPHPHRHALRHARRGLELDEHRAVAAQSPAVGVYASTDGGASFSLVLPPDRSTRSSSTRATRARSTRRRSSATGRPPPLDFGRRRRDVDADLPVEPRALLVRAGDAAERQDAHLPRRRERRRPGRAGLPHRRREPAGGDADRVDATRRGRGSRTRRTARPGSRSTTTATRRSSARSADTTCSSCRRPTGPTWSSSAGSCTTRS